MLLQLMLHSSLRGATSGSDVRLCDFCKRQLPMGRLVWLSGPKTVKRFQHNESNDGSVNSDVKISAVPVIDSKVLCNVRLDSSQRNSLFATALQIHPKICTSQTSLPTLSSRQFSTSTHRRKEESIAERTVRELKEKVKGEAEKAKAEKKGKEEKEMTEFSVPATSETSPSAPPVPAKKPIGQRIMAVLRHYAHGFRLLFIDFKIAARLVWRVLNGATLSRREKQQLVRTTADMFRLVPFLVIIIVPFAELLLPVLLIVFPNMLPSTFKEEDKEQEKIRKRLKVQLEMARFLQETVKDMALQRKESDDAKKYNDFVNFMQKVRSSGVAVNTDEIMKFSQLFEDEITLDAMGPEQLKAINRLLDLPTMGPSSFLRFRLDMALKKLEADDKLIQKEGVDTLVTWELQEACRARGMRAAGVPEDRLKLQLSQWLDLHLNHKIPTSLLLLSRALYLPEQLAPPELLKATISALPQDAADEAKVKVSKVAAERVDNRAKLDYIRREEAAIKKEKEEEAKHQAQEAARRQADELKARQQIASQLGAQRVEGTPSLVDSAPTDTEKPRDGELFIDEATPRRIDTSKKNKDDEISQKDLKVIEEALTKVVNTKAKMQHEKLKLADLKGDVHDYKENLQNLKSIVVTTGGKEGDIRESKAAQLLGKKVNQMIGRMDDVMDRLLKEKMSLQESLEMKEVKVKRSAELQEDKSARQAVMKEIDAAKSHLVDINELVLSLRRLQKVPTDTRYQRIVQVLDEDKDGVIDAKDALRVIELLGSENVKMDTSQVADVIRLLQMQTQAEEEEGREKVKAKAAATATSNDSKEVLRDVATPIMDKQIKLVEERRDN